MAWVFVRLKARLLANGLRGGTQRVVGTVVAAVYGTVLAAAGFVTLAVAGGHRGDGVVIAVLFGAALVAGWATVPLLGFGSDETLDPTRLELLPLTRRQLMTGLLAASLVGIGPTATFIALSGAVAGFAPNGPGAVLVVAAVVVQGAVCISLSRAVVTALSASLRSRRGRDLRVLIVPLVGILPEALRLVLLPGHTTVASFRPAADVVGWLPFVLPMRAVVAASHERLAVAAGDVALGGATVVVLCWWWARTLDRIATVPEAPATRSRRPTAALRDAGTGAGAAVGGGARPPSGARAGPAAAAPGDGDALFGRLLAWLPRSRAGAVAAREVRVSWRDPRRRVQVISTVVFPFLVLAGVLAKGVAHRPSLVYASLLAVALGGSRANNQLGMDGRAWWVHEASGADWRSDLRGKNLSLALTSLPLAAATAVVLAALTGGWSQVVPAVLLTTAICLVQLGIGNVVSLRAPWAVPQSRSNAWASSAGQGCFVALIMILALLVLGLVSLPGIVAMIAVPSAVGRILIGVVGVAYGYGWWRLGLTVAVGIGRRRGPEVLASLSEGSGAR